MLLISGTDGSNRWPSAAPAPAAPTSTAMASCSLLLEPLTDFWVYFVTVLPLMSWLIAVVAPTLLSPCLSIHCGHSRSVCCGCRCTLPSRVSALEAAPAGIAVLVLVLAVLIVVTVAVRLSRHNVINGGVDQHWSQVG